MVYLNQLKIENGNRGITFVVCQSGEMSSSCIKKIWGEVRK